MSVDTTRNLEDLTHGQSVVVTARWILVLAGLAFAAWNPGPVGELRLEIALLLGLAAANFHVHARLLAQRPLPLPVAYAASAVDLGVVTLVVLAQHGAASEVYVFYFPAILALSVTFPTEVTVAFTAATAILYTLVAAPACAGDLAVLITRVLALSAVALCGYTYRRIEHARRVGVREAVLPARLDPSPARRSR
jgi:hypothetical protein